MSLYGNMLMVLKLDLGNMMTDGFYLRLFKSKERLARKKFIRMVERDALCGEVIVEIKDGRSHKQII